VVLEIRLYSGMAMLFYINWKVRAEDNLEAVVITIY
jgi:hypothetical protein